MTPFETFPAVLLLGIPAALLVTTGLIAATSVIADLIIWWEDRRFARRCTVQTFRR